MKVVILCGGKGGRIQSNETGYLPKPLVQIAGKPMLHRIMDYYYARGYGDFILALGHRHEEIIRSLGNYCNVGPRVDTMYTGEADEVNTAGRLLRLARILELEDNFILTYCDIIHDIDIDKLVDEHLSHSNPATVAVTNPKLPFGIATFNYFSDTDQVKSFRQKPILNDLWANTGVYVINTMLLKVMRGGDLLDLDADILPELAKTDQLGAYRHAGLWFPVNTESELRYVNELWEDGELEDIKRDERSGMAGVS